MKLLLRHSFGEDMILAGDNLPFDDTANIYFTPRPLEEQAMLSANTKAEQAPVGERTVAVLFSGYTI